MSTVKHQFRFFSVIRIIRLIVANLLWVHSITLISLAAAVSPATSSTPLHFVSVTLLFSMTVEEGAEVAALPSSLDLALAAAAAVTHASAKVCIALSKSMVKHCL